MIIALLIILFCLYNKWLSRKLGPIEMWQCFKNPITLISSFPFYTQKYNAFFTMYQERYNEYSIRNFGFES